MVILLAGKSPATFIALRMNSCRTGRYSGRRQEKTWRADTPSDPAAPTKKASAPPAAAEKSGKAERPGFLARS
jgi:hypothetical protein